MKKNSLILKKSIIGLTAPNRVHLSTSNYYHSDILAFTSMKRGIFRDSVFNLASMRVMLYEYKNFPLSKITNMKISGSQPGGRKLRFERLPKIVNKMLFYTKVNYTKINKIQLFN